MWKVKVPKCSYVYYLLPWVPLLPRPLPSLLPPPMLTVALSSPYLPRASLRMCLPPPRLIKDQTIWSYRETTRRLVSGETKFGLTTRLEYIYDSIEEGEDLKEGDSVTDAARTLDDVANDGEGDEVHNRDWGEVERERGRGHDHIWFGLVSR